MGIVQDDSGGQADVALIYQGSVLNLAREAGDPTPADPILPCSCGARNAAQEVTGLSVPLLVHSGLVDAAHSGHRRSSRICCFVFSLFAILYYPLSIVHERVISPAISTMVRSRVCLKPSAEGLEVHFVIAFLAIDLAFVEVSIRAEGAFGLGGANLAKLVDFRVSTMAIVRLAAAY
jgi:hypothetical protein